MSVTPYTPGPSKIVHESRVDFRQRVIQSMIHIVQYDKSLPIIAVELYSNGQKWTLPSDANVKVRWGKRDHTYVYLDVLGCNAERTVVYFEIVEQMTVFYGEHNPVLEVIIGDSVACSSYIPFYIDRNPIQRTDVESEVVPSVVDMLEAEIRSKQNILVSGTNIKTINGQSILGSGDLVVSGGFDPSTIPSGTIATDSIVGLNSLGALVKGNLDGKYVKVIDYIPSGTLTEEQLNTVINGCFVNGNIAGIIQKPVFFPAHDNQYSTAYQGFAEYVAYSTPGTNRFVISEYSINKSNRQLYLNDGNPIFQYSITSPWFLFKKLFPFYPSDTTKQYKFVQLIGGNLAWTEDVSTDLTNYYTKSETDTLLGAKQATLVSGTSIKTINGQSLLGSGDITISADLTNYYTKTETDTLLLSKVDSSALASYYTKTETDNLLAAKADDSNVVHLSGGGVVSPLSTATNPNFRTDINGSTISIYDFPYRNSTTTLSNTGLTLINNSSYYTTSMDYTGFISKFGRYTASGYRYAHNGIHKISNDTETDLYSFPNSSGTIALTSDLDSKQDTLVSGTNIKTVNGYSIVGSGNVDAVKKVVLYSGASGYSVLLNTNYTPASDFDIVIVFLQYNGTDTQQSHCIIDASWMNNINNSYNYNIHENVVKLQYNPDTHYLWNANNNCQIYKVIGLKFNNA